jgi:hypothetical protein
VTPLAAAAPPASGQLFGLIVIAVAVTLGMRRRMRPQPVRELPTALTAVAIVAVSALGLLGSYHLVLTPLGAALGVVMLAAGAGTGFLLVRHTRFWRNERGELWMQGGIVFMAIFLGTLVLRLGVRYVSTGSAFGATPTNEPATPLNVLSADALLFSVGLWIARAVLLILRARRPAG